MRSDLGQALLAALLLAGGPAQAADAPVVEAYVKFISATKPLAGIGIIQDKKAKGLVIPTDMLTDVFYYRGPARMELIELATTELPAEPAPAGGEKTEVVKRPVRGIKATAPTHALTPSGKPPVAWIDLPAKQGQLHLILMVNPGKDNGITAIPDVPGSFPPGSNRYFNLCPFPLTVKLPSGDQQIPPGGSKVARPGSKDKVSVEKVKPRLTFTTVSLHNKFSNCAICVWKRSASRFSTTKTWRASRHGFLQSSTTLT